jgi:ferritin-like metal-binding protein YciE
MAKEPRKLDELFHDTLKDIYFGEKKLLVALPKMAKAAHAAELKKAFEKHKGETEGQVKRLEQVFALIDKKPQAKTCEAIMGIVRSGDHDGVQGISRPRSGPARRRAGGRAL